MFLFFLAIASRCVWKREKSNALKFQIVGFYFKKLCSRENDKVAHAHKTSTHIDVHVEEPTITASEVAFIMLRHR